MRALLPSQRPLFLFCFRFFALAIIAPPKRNDTTLLLELKRGTLASVAYSLPACA